MLSELQEDHTLLTEIIQIHNHNYLLYLETLIALDQKNQSMIVLTCLEILLVLPHSFVPHKALLVSFVMVSVNL